MNFGKSFATHISLAVSQDIQDLAAAWIIWCVPQAIIGRYLFAIHFGKRLLDLPDRIYCYMIILS